MYLEPEVSIRDKEERKLQKVKVNLMRNKIFARMSGLMMVGTTKIVEGTVFGRTDGFNEEYGRPFIAKHSEREVGYVVVHESGHKMLRDIQTWAKLWKKNHKLTNQATDYVLNLIVSDMDPTEQFIAFPRDPVTGERLGLYDERFRGMHVKQVYDILEQEEKEKQKLPQPKQDEGQPRQGQGQGQGNGSPQQSKRQGPADGGGFDEHDWEAGQERTEAEEAEVEKEVDRAIRQGKMLHEKLNGKGNGSVDRLFDKLVTPKINWKRETQEFVTAYCIDKEEATYRKLNRRFVGLDIYLPIMIGETLNSVVMATDMSGSIHKEIPTFMTEMVSLMKMVKPEKVDVLYWDSQVTAHETYTQNTLDNLLSETKPKGGGGTQPSCVSNYMAKHKMKPDCIIVLTDGEVGSDWGNNWPAPVLWVVVNPYRQITAPVGKTIYIPEFD